MVHYWSYYSICVVHFFSLFIIVPQDGKKTKVPTEKEKLSQEKMLLSEAEASEAEDPTYHTGSEIDEVTFKKRCLLY